MFEKDQLDAIDETLRTNLMVPGVECIILMNVAGNTITQHDNGECDINITAFAALAAGNFAAVDAMAKLVGESEFALLFHKGEKVSVHFSKVNDEIFLITIFNTEIALGTVRLKVDETIDFINEVCGIERG